MATISYKSRIEAINRAIKPVADEHNFKVIMADQVTSPIRNSSSPIAYVGIQSHNKISFQDLHTEWDETAGNYITSGIYEALNYIFIDYYTNNYDFIDISQEIQIILNNTDFSEHDMTCSFFETIPNNTSPDIVQGRLRQSAKTVCAFYMTDKIALPVTYKADRIDINGTIGSSSSFSIEVNLDG